MQIYYIIRLKILFFIDFSIFKCDKILYNNIVILINKQDKVNVIRWSVDL